MTWFGEVLIAFFAVNAGVCVAAVGKPRRPLTFGQAETVVVVNALLILGVALVGTGHAS